MRTVKYSKALLLMVLTVIYCGAVYADYSTDALMRMTIESLSYDIKSDTASVCGVGKILQNDSLGVMWARRAAITDAQRGLLILKRSILEDQPPSPDSVSGSVPPFRILSDDIRDGLYFVEICAVLSELVDEEHQAVISQDYTEQEN